MIYYKEMIFRQKYVFCVSGHIILILILKSYMDFLKHYTYVILLQKWKRFHERTNRKYLQNIEEIDENDVSFENPEKNNDILIVE